MNEKFEQVLKESELPDKTKSFGFMGSVLELDPDTIIKGMINITNSELTRKSKQVKMPYPKGLTKTERVVHDMLKESTGVDMMDSGGNCGRHWQTNQQIFDFRRQDKVTYDVDGEYVYARLSIFHFLTNALEYEESMTDIFNDGKNKDESDYYNMSDIADILNDHYNDLNFGELQEFKLKGDSFNSYNWESNLSQVIQGQMFTEYEDTQNEENYIILQIHNGADIRGGYTDCKVFKVDLDVWYSQDNFNLSCKCKDWYNTDPQKIESCSTIKKNRKKYSDHIYYCTECKTRVFAWSPMT